jgi:hypothetical protein
MDPEGQVFGLGQTVIPGFHLTFQHSRVFIPHLIEIIFPGAGWRYSFQSPLQSVAMFMKLSWKCTELSKKFRNAAPLLKDLGLVFLLCQLVIDILKLDGLCIIVFPDPADAVLKHPVKRNTLLCGPRNTVIFLRVLYDFRLLFSGPLPLQMLRHLIDLPLFFAGTASL